MKKNLSDGQSTLFRFMYHAVCLSLGITAGPVSADVDFSREVLPILSDKCFHCHGPDAKARKAGLRLDIKEGAFRTRKGRTTIVPGKSADSELIRRITSADAEDQMPPPDSNRKLTPTQIETLKHWVDEGAKWSQHWAFVPPTRPPVPGIQAQGWARNEIDRFILARLEKEGLRPSKEASRETWLRRVTLDLTGLPSTQPEIENFLKDKTPTAYEKVVDRLFRSSRYGERMASEWLDLARYSDTHGYQMDRYRPVWPWRDWVIKVFNQNMPYDQYVTWQLAGDLLPNPTKEQRLATAFNRMHMQNEEGGIVEEEFRVAYVVDRVNTFGTAFLGLTLDCTRCHNHKYDPLTMKDYYSLFAMFQNIDESGQTSFFTAATPVPALQLTDDATDRRLAELRAKIALTERKLDGQTGSADVQFADSLILRQQVDFGAGLQASFSFDEIRGNQITNSADAKKPGQAHEGPRLVPGKFGKAAELNGENGFVFPGLGHFSSVDPFSFGLWLKPTILSPRAVVLHHSQAPVDAGSRGYELLLENGHVAFGLHHMWPGNSLKVTAYDPIPINEWSHVAATYDGSSHASGVRLYLNGRRVPQRVIRDKLSRDITYDGGEPNLAIGYRFRDNGFKGGRVDDFRIYQRELAQIEVAGIAQGLNGKVRPDEIKESQFTTREQWQEYYLKNVHAPSIKLRTELHALRKEENRLVASVPEIMVMDEMSPPKPAFVLTRGAYDAPGERVSPDTPAAFPPLTAGQPHNRLGLARWLVSAEHPLTSRVAVNRIWQMVFGRGLTETSDNFGSQGSPPSHPELLDWLAVDFRENGWDVQRLLQQLALSATYRQSSTASTESLSRDSENRLLARAPARRLTAEMIRDQALAVSGLLVEKTGGPSVKPYQPDGLWEVAMGAPQYDRAKGPDLYRRSLYTFWKRTVPHPAMTTFDAAERNVCIVRRQTTSTPLQALALLNDPQIVEAAKMLGQRMLKEGGTTTIEQITWAFRQVTGRRPSDKELSVMRKLFEEQSEIFRKDTTATARLLMVGDARPDAKLKSSELAASTVLALTILNHDEAVMRR